MLKVSKNGFTLVELLAVIVVLGIITALAVPKFSEYIDNSRKDTMLSTAQEFISATKTLLSSDDSLPAIKEAVFIPISSIDLSRGGLSPYTNKSFNDSNYKSYVLVYNDENNYIYFVSLIDDDGNCLDTVSEELLLSLPTKEKRKHIKDNNSCLISEVYPSSNTVSYFNDNNILETVSLSSFNIYD